MESLASFLYVIETLPLWQKALYVGSCLLLFVLLENLASAQQFIVDEYYSRSRHILKNLLFLLFSLLINSAFAALFIAGSSWSEQAGFGLYSHFYSHFAVNPALPMASISAIPAIIQLLISLVLLDFIAQYLCHVGLHKIPWLWRLHTVHHNDFHVDLSTGSRHHPIDYCTRELAALACVIILAMPISHYLLYKLLSVFFTYFTHANILLPRWIERPLSLIFVTPNMHKVQHHQYLPFTDSNYGNILSIWDRLFGTLMQREITEIEYGVDTDLAEQELAIGYQLQRPFMAKQQR